MRTQMMRTSSKKMGMRQNIVKNGCGQGKSCGNFYCLLIAIAILFQGCKKEKTINNQAEKEILIQEIGNDDYFLEYSQGKSDKYFLNDNTLMDGYYIIVDKGVLKEKIQLSMGILNGVQKYYKKNYLYLEENYINGVKDGESKGYHENGKLKSKRLYKNDSIIGKSLYYDKLGNIESESGKINGLDYSKNYREGKLIGEEYDYIHNSGKISVIKMYDDKGKVDQVMGLREADDNSMEDFLLLMDENHNVLDSLNPDIEKDREKLMKLFMKYGLEL